MTYTEETSHGGGKAARTIALALALTAAVLLLAGSSLPRQGGPAAAALLPATASRATACDQWAATRTLGGGCLAKLDGGVSDVPCCGGQDYKCRKCPAAKVAALRCVSPRHMLLQAAPGCGAALAEARECLQLSAADALQGRWVNASAAPPGPSGTPPLLFHPASDAARGPPMGAAEALHRLWGAGFDRVVVSGDSTVRHVYNRLVSLLRQQENVIDGGGIAHAHYRLQAWALPGAGTGSESGSGSWLTDEFWVSPAANFEKGSWDEALMADGLAELLPRSFPADGPLGSSADSSVGNRSSGSEVGQGLTVDFVIGAKVAWQQPHVRSYLAVQGPDGGAWRRRTLLLLSVCMWEQTQVFRDGWLEFVEEVRQQVGQVALLTCPVDRLRRKQHAEGRKLVAQRNERLRAMVARGRGGDAAPAGPEGQDGQQDSNQPLGGGGGAASRRRLPDRGGAGSAGTARPLLLMDLDGITQRLPPRSNLGVAPIDFHYQCMLSSTTTYDGAGPIRWGGGDGSPSPTYPVMRYERLLVPPAGTCADPVNYAGWELLLGMLCRAE